MEKEIIKTIQYFNRFSYPPSQEEIHQFLLSKTTKEELKKKLKQMVEKKQLDCYNVERLTFNVKSYTLGEYSIIKSQKSKVSPSSFGLRGARKSQNFETKYNISQKKIQKIKLYVKTLSFFPQIKLIGLSGTVAMMNADHNDDIDLFIITAKNRLWTGRFITLFLAQLLGLRRKRGVDKASDKVCLNLFFDESDLAVPKYKRTEYVAHEVLQMKPLITKDKVYERFLEANNWAFKIFPNASSVMPNSPACRRGRFRHPEINSGRRLFEILKQVKDDRLIKKIKLILGGSFELLLKKFQLEFINKHQTNELITDSQLWFHPVDFGEKIRQILSAPNTKHDQILF